MKGNPDAPSSHQRAIHCGFGKLSSTTSAHRPRSSKAAAGGHRCKNTHSGAQRRAAKEAGPIRKARLRSNGTGQLWTISRMWLMVSSGKDAKLVATSDFPVAGQRCCRMKVVRRNVAPSGCNEKSPNGWLQRLGDGGNARAGAFQGASVKLRPACVCLRTRGSSRSRR